MKCEKCGTENESDAKFCMECGAKITIVAKTEKKSNEKKTDIPYVLDMKDVQVFGPFGDINE